MLIMRKASAVYYIALGILLGIAVTHLLCKSGDKRITEPSIHDQHVVENLQTRAGRLKWQLSYPSLCRSVKSAKSPLSWHCISSSAVVTSHSKLTQLHDPMQFMSSGRHSSVGNIFHWKLKHFTRLIQKLNQEIGQNSLQHCNVVTRTSSLLHTLLEGSHDRW